MTNAFFDGLYRQVEVYLGSTPIHQQERGLLADACVGYSHVLSLLFMAPWLEKTYGSFKHVYGQLQQTAQALAQALDNEMPAAERARHLATLLDSIFADEDAQRLEVAMNGVNELLGSAEGNEAGEEACCKLQCYLNYFEAPSVDADPVPTILNGWCAQQLPDGSWHLADRQAVLLRLETLVLYRQTADPNAFSQELERALDFYTRAPFFRVDLEGPSDYAVRLMHVLLNAGASSALQPTVEALVSIFAAPNAPEATDSAPAATPAATPAPTSAPAPLFRAFRALSLYVLEEQKQAYYKQWENVTHKL